MEVTLDGKYTYDGMPVRILCIDAAGTKPVVGLVGSTLYRWHKSGQYHEKEACAGIDLQPVKETRTYYRRKWIRWENADRVTNDLPFEQSKEVFDQEWVIPNVTASDEWETITI